MISEAQAGAIAQLLEAGWNAGDGPAFAAPFLADATFVNVRGLLMEGRQAIADGHDGIFRGLYAGSLVRYAVRRLAGIAPGVALLHLDSELTVPAGPLAGEHRALLSLLLTEGHGGDWGIKALHNTLVTPMPGATAATTGR